MVIKILIKYEETIYGKFVTTFGAGSSYRLGLRWQAEAELWFTPATSFAPRNVGVALGAAFAL